MIELLNMDCMEYMKNVTDKYFDLAIVDPPYGIGAGHKNFINRNTLNKKAEKFYRETDWDIKPDVQYFNELIRVCNKYIIWGGNHFVNNLLPARCYIVWNKKTGDNSYADCELALTNIDANAKIFTKFWLGAHANDGTERIHPTQKPISLYKWLLKNYAKDGDKIFDSHLGSGSIAIACHDLKFDLVGTEIDKDYYDAAVKRFDDHKKQLQLW